MNKNVEILAPAGNNDSLIAAVRSGADAVYLGVGKFNARQNADNFSQDNLKEVIAYCHLRGVKVYITLNTLVADAELPDAFELVKCGCAFGADAFIIQDLGIAKLIKTLAPSMPIHASTQMSVSIPAGFKELESLGYSRAVVPRELSLSELKAIRNSTDIELEMFIHGALCMCVSGQCYLSAMLGGRSGNRGLCAQPCRLAFSAPNGTGHDLSLKDLSLIDYLPQLKELPIESFKIEGRMKRPEYVAGAVKACQSALKGCKDDSLYSNLKAVFSRSGFTDGYYCESLGKPMFGVRSKDDVMAATTVLKDLQKLYDKEKICIPISIGFKAEIGKPILVSASTGKTIVFVTSDSKVQAAKNHSTEVSTIRAQLKKCGGTPFDVKMTDIDIDQNINIPVSEINNARRKVLAELEKKLTANSTVPCAENVNDFQFACKNQLKESTHSHVNKSKIYLRVDNISQIPTDMIFSEYDVAKIIVPASTPEDKFSILKKSNVEFGIEIPRSLYGATNKIEKQIKTAIKKGATFTYVGTIDGIVLAKKYKLPIIGGFTLNAFNSISIDELANLGVSEATASVELQISNINKLHSSIPLGIISYGNIPLMLTRNCPIKNGKDCKACKRNSYLTDRKGIKFPVICTNGASEILNSVPVYLADKQEEFSNLDFQILYFTKETPEKVKSILACYKKNGKPQLEFTRGLYYRGVE